MEPALLSFLLSTPLFLFVYCYSPFNIEKNEKQEEEDKEVEGIQEGDIEGGRRTDKEEKEDKGGGGGCTRRRKRRGEETGKDD